MKNNKSTFAEACYNMNSIAELENALQKNADQSDMKTWKLTENEWREQIILAIKMLKE